MKTKSHNVIINYSSNILKLFYKFATKQIFTAKSAVLYEGQTPVVAYIISKGEASIRENKKETNITQGNVIGLKELLTHQKSTIEATIEKDSEVYIIDRSTIKEILETDEVLSKELQKLIA